MSANQQFYTVPPEIQAAVAEYNRLLREAKREGKKIRPKGKERKWMPRAPYVPAAPQGAAAPQAPQGAVVPDAQLFIPSPDLLVAMREYARQRYQAKQEGKIFIPSPDLKAANREYKKQHNQATREGKKKQQQGWPKWMYGAAVAPASAPVAPNPSWITGPAALKAITK